MMQDVVNVLFIWHITQPMPKKASFQHRIYQKILKINDKRMNITSLVTEGR